MNITNVLHPEMFVYMIVAIAIVIYLSHRKFVPDDIGDRRERKKFRNIIMGFRILMLILLFTALAKPFGEVTVTTPGDPKITILVDNSSSMKVMDTKFFAALQRSLENQFPVTVKNIGDFTNSDLGEETLAYLEQDTNLLLVTDGNVNKGATLEDVAMLAANLNSTISAIRLEEAVDDVGVYITGPDTSVSGVNTTYMVNIVNVGGQDVSVKVSVDGQEVLSRNTKEKQFALSRSLTEGEHRIEASVSATNNFFNGNNNFYKSVSVVKKPKVLYISNAEDDVDFIFNALYDVTKASSIPQDVNQYYAVIINDMPANIPGIERLADYLIDQQGGYYGNGLFVIGGFDSFDRGGYKNTILESYLPVTVGTAARKRGSSNIAIAIDYSGTTGARIELVQNPDTGEWEKKTIEGGVQDVNKALAVSVINSLGPDNNVGVSLFSAQHGTVQELKPLFQTKADLLDKIAKATIPAGQSYFHMGLNGAYQILKDNVGSNNIILITDGNTGNPQIKTQTIDTAKTLNSRGVRVYVVGTGRNVDEEFLKDVAYNGGGIYFPADQQNNLRILFGEPQDSKFGEVFDLFVLNQYHYITQGLTTDASLYGFNQVIPKTNALTLITTQHGEPAVTVWNYGLGRVAALNVFSGNNNLGDLLSPRNSLIITRITNWVIGDPQRKDAYYVTIEDARKGSVVDVIVKSDKYPTVEGMSFTRTGENLYKSSFLAEEAGFSQMLGKTYATNYELEYQQLGLNPNLEQTVVSTGGKLFKPEDHAQIIDFVKSVSKATRTERTTIVWPFLVAAAVVFLIELLIRKIREYSLNR